MSNLSLADFQSRHIDTLIDTPDARSKKVFFRSDFNTPMRDGVITDNTRIERGAAGIAALADAGARVIVASHCGRPKGKVDEALSLAPHAKMLAEIIKRPVGFMPDCIGNSTAAAVAAMQDGDVILLENLRFHHGEEAGDDKFAKALASMADIYVNDAFSVSHRNHASVVALAKLLPAYAGALLMEEITALSMALENPARPLVAIIGGAKVSTKLEVLGNLVSKVDYLIIGGAMANTFLLVEGHKIGASLAEPEMVLKATQIGASADKGGCKIILPQDVVVASGLTDGANSRKINMDEEAVHDNEMILDIGIGRVSSRAIEAIDKAKTIIWNGPMGVFETPPFDEGTKELARHVAMRGKEHGVIAVAGGGDTVAALGAAGVKDDFHYVSTAGGAFLEWMEGKTLPGLAALLSK